MSHVLPGHEDAHEPLVLPLGNLARDPVIAVDAMGGDYAPDEIVAGALAAQREHRLTTLLTGPPAQLRPVIARLVRRCAERSGGVEAERLAVELGAPRRRTRVASELVDPLSARERDVLRYLPSRLTAKEIAAECFMSPNTVKAHLKRIYSKLGVSTRGEAVQRATMLGELRISATRTG